jgi:hypothetical protein
MNWFSRAIDYLVTPSTPNAQQQRIAEQQERGAQAADQAAAARPVVAPERPDVIGAAIKTANQRGDTATIKNLADLAGQASRSNYDAVTKAALGYIQQTDALQGEAPIRTAGTIRQVSQNVETIDFDALTRESMRPNPLDEYANYTYHIKFWMTSESLSETVSSSKGVVDAIPKVVIAESGATAGFNITEFTLRNLVGTNNETRNMPSVSYTMKIIEPYGFSLPDRLNSTAQQFGTINWQRAKFFIEVWFVGYDENGAPVDQALFHQIYRVVITTINFSGNEGGGSYEVQGIMDGQIGYTNQLDLQTSTISVSATTVGDFFDKFQKALNFNQETLALGTAPLAQYEIRLPNEMRSWQMNKSRLSDDQRSKNMNIKAEGNTVQITATKGIDFSSLVYQTLSLCDEFKNWTQGGQNQQGSVTTLTHGLVKNVKIHSKVSYVGYDFRAGKYVEKVTYTIVPYWETRVRGEDIPTIRAVEKRNVQMQKLKFLLTSGRIKKRYEWIYTGLNLDIIKFDLKVNNFFAIATVPYAGTNNYSNQTIGPLANDKASAWEQRLAQYRKAKERYNALPKQIQEAERLVEGLQNANQKLRGLTAQLQEKDSYGELRVLGAERLILLRERQQIVANIPGLNTAQQQVAALQQERNTLEQNLRQQTQDFVDFYDREPSAIIQDNPQALARRRGVEQLRSRFAAVNQENQQLFVEDQDIIDPDFPYVNTVIPNDAARQADGNQGAASQQTPTFSTNQINYPKSRSLFGSVIGNFDSANKEMIKIDLEIRGDPWWMGHSNIDIDAAVPDKLADLNSNFAELIGGDNMYYLTFRSGQAPNPETGFMEFTQNNQFVDGFYLVIQVKNIFANGKFSQVLTSCKDTFSQHGNTAMDSYIKKADEAAKKTEQARIAPASPVQPQRNLQPLGNPSGDVSGY